MGDTHYEIITPTRSIYALYNSRAPRTLTVGDTETFEVVVPTRDRVVEPAVEGDGRPEVALPRVNFDRVMADDVGVVEADLSARPRREDILDHRRLESWPEAATTPAVRVAGLAFDLPRGDVADDVRIAGDLDLDGRLLLLRGGSEAGLL